MNIEVKLKVVNYLAYVPGIVGNRLLMCCVRVEAGLHNVTGPHEMSAEAALTLAPVCGDLNLEALLRTF